MACAGAKVVSVMPLVSLFSAAQAMALTKGEVTATSPKGLAFLGSGEPFIRHSTVTIWPRVMVLLGMNIVSVTPLKMLFS